ncbi:bromo-adjacent homology (BAH) domain-containing protein isoform X2 [Tasmannia lanceolata]|uniref:bromo-adjacent homology (BAH) domain-containing protein isoform X2 n=1 Tax=Tasmannia lanceolata TaxID=3420 RepID=UPI0040647647
MPSINTERNRVSGEEFRLKNRELEGATERERKGFRPSSPVVLLEIRPSPSAPSSSPPKPYDFTSGGPAGDNKLEPYPLQFGDMPAMSHSEDADGGENPIFKWGQKRGVGGAKKDAQFYESFTYDGIEYFLYDCVYLYKEGEPEPFIGKLLKIWEQSNRRRVKVLWFFRPIELLNWLREDVTLENEIFLACGEGLGLTNVNPLEVIVGKCNVICTSKDRRNRQPSDEEMKMADYIFYRTFNVANCTISDKLDNVIAGTEVSDLLNKKGQKPLAISKFDSNGKDENDNVVENSLPLPLLLKLHSTEAPENVVKEEKSGPATNSVAKESVGVKALLVKDKLLFHKGVESKEIASPMITQEPFRDEKTIERAYNDSAMVEVKAGEEKVKPVKGSGVFDSNANAPDKSRLIDNSSKAPKELNSSVTVPSSREENKTDLSLRKREVDSDDEYEKETIRAVKDSAGQDKIPSKRVKLDEEKTKPGEGTLRKTEPVVALKEDAESDGQIMEVTRRPDADRSKWFRKLPWEERMQTANEQGTLVLLENLDPAYTSEEIEDIIWHGFREQCTAKMIQRTLFSSPHCGQAFVIFKTREAAEMAVRRLNGGCLMLPNGRPLVGSKGTPRVPGKPSKFTGHLYIEKIKLQMHREEMKRAVSTSHCSQPNTIEYQMAMEWRLLQDKSELWWKELYKRQGEELKVLRRTLKDK